jgi:hypothetical protein
MIPLVDGPVARASNCDRISSLLIPIPARQATSTVAAVAFQEIGIIEG